MTGLQNIPFNYIPEEWDRQWFKEFIRDVLADADVRNAEGIGVTITGEPSQTATISNDTLSNSFIVLAANPNLANERILAVETGVLLLTDNGPNLTVVISVVTNGIIFAKIQQIAASSILGSVAGGDVSELTGTQVTALLDAATTSLLGLVKEATAVTDLNQTISDPPTQTQVQDLSDKVDELLAVMRTAGQLA